MTPTFTWPDAESAAHDKLIADVKEHGCHILKVAGDGCADFSYSVGLYLNFAHPEILVIGLSGDKAMQLINLARDRIAGGDRFEDGSVSTELVRDLPVTFVTVEPEHYADRVGFANRFYESLPPCGFPLLQLVWPDRQGRFPWDAGFDPGLRAVQPVLCKVA